MSDAGRCAVGSMFRMGKYGEEKELSAESQQIW